MSSGAGVGVGVGSAAAGGVAWGVGEGSPVGFIVGHGGGLWAPTCEAMPMAAATAKTNAKSRRAGIAINNIDSRFTAIS